MYLSVKHMTSHMKRENKTPFIKGKCDPSIIHVMQVHYSQIKLTWIITEL